MSPTHCPYNRQYERFEHVDYIGPTGYYGPHQFSQTSRHKDTVRAVCMFCLKVFVVPYVEEDTCG